MKTYQANKIHQLKGDESQRSDNMIYLRIALVVRNAASEMIRQEVVGGSYGEEEDVNMNRYFLLDCHPFNYYNGRWVEKYSTEVHLLKLFDVCHCF